MKTTGRRQSHRDNLSIGREVTRGPVASPSSVNGSFDSLGREVIRLRVLHLIRFEAILTVRHGKQRLPLKEIK